MGSTSIDWKKVASDLSGELPSPALREAVIAILTRVENLGPLVGADRTPGDEFRRVYTFLTYNEASRVETVVEERLAAFRRGGKKQLAHHNAWNYTVGAFDLWLSRARIFYMATGLIEGALRARLDARLTDQFGRNWPQVTEAVPSILLPLASGERPGELIGAVRRLLSDPDTEIRAEALLASARSLLATGSLPPQQGSEFVAELQFGELRTFFQTKRLWSKGPKLEALFNDPATGKAPLHSLVNGALEGIHKVRNAVAHYDRPHNMQEPSSVGAQAEVQSPPSFTRGLYELARLARWMGVDLQHFYGAVDTRHTTEMSLLIEDPSALANAVSSPRACSATNCMLGEPLDILLRRAPSDAAGFQVGDGAYACLYHRVQLRAQSHRPLGE